MTVNGRDAAPSPSAEHVANSLAERIASGAYPEGAWFPTERELVDEFGVSRTIIRQAVEVLHRRQLVVRSPRCRTVIAGSGRHRHAVLPATRRHNVGVWIWPGPRTPASAAVVQGIHADLDADRYRVVIGSPTGEDWPHARAEEAAFLERLARDEDIAGILLWYIGDEANLASLQRVRGAGIPLVFLDRLPPAGFDADYVGVDNVHAAEAAVRHLIQLGHRRIAHVTNEDSASTVVERMEGYRAALAAAGIPFLPELVVTAKAGPPEHGHETFAPLVDRLLGLVRPPTAVFAVNDVIALNLLAELRSRDVHVPDDMGLVGFDGIERWLPGPAFLTTIEQPFERIGARAVQLLLRRIEAGPAAAYNHVMLEAPLRVLASSSVARP